MNTHTLFVITILCLTVAFCEWLSRKPFFRPIGTALLVILLTAFVANIGLIPTGSQSEPAYDAIFSYVAPLSIFFLMLSVNLKSIRRAGPVMIGLFLLGGFGTVVGVLVAMKGLDAASHLGESHFAIAGMLTGTYIGGSINFNALAIQYNVAREGVLFAAVTAADNIITALWMIVTLALPAIMGKKKNVPLENLGEEAVPNNSFDETETIHPLDISLLMALAFGAFTCANVINEAFPVISPIMVLTTLALILAQVPAIGRLRGSRVLGLFMIYLFLSVIGAYCDLAALWQNGTLALWLLGIIGLIVGIHALVLFGFARLFRQDWDAVAVASQANIGGSSSALALARSLGRPDLQLPAILVGTLGNGIGTYAGLLLAEWLR
ncbi:DUF819 family protein [Arundinibacter roseus]|uniref:DUF819 family protein n=1 Tax=Arundinibacter roseus TaxID=2070510 RepID=A0A4R4KGZ9_9BACT|nr:DUF819 family protein [Arundinibacter roseus]TDB65891.1 DUF819 family protein [Arundinibacter roseus]